MSSPFIYMICWAISDGKRNRNRPIEIQHCDTDGSIRAVDLKIQISKSCSGSSQFRNRNQPTSCPRNRLRSELEPFSATGHSGIFFLTSCTTRWFHRNQFVEHLALQCVCTWLLEQKYGKYPIFFFWCKCLKSWIRQGLVFPKPSVEIEVGTWDSW